MKHAPKTSTAVTAAGMLDEPSLSRQWVARRLQRALSVERWGSPLRTGLAGVGSEHGRTLADHGDAAARRAAVLEELIREVGAEPYGSWGLGARLARAAAGIVGRGSGALSRRLAMLLAEHTLSEYRTLEAFVQEAPGVSDAVAAAVTPLREEAAVELRDLAPWGGN